MTDPEDPADRPAATPTHLRLGDRAHRKTMRFSIEPDAAARAALAEDLGISALRKLRLAGELAPAGRRDWLLRADLGASVVQPCVVSLAPVATRIDEEVRRHYSADWREPETDDAEAPQDDTLEPLPETLDLMAVLREALALALPLYPRAPGAELGSLTVTEPGVAPLTDEDARPFAGLRALRDADPDPQD